MGQTESTAQSKDKSITDDSAEEQTQTESAVGRGLTKAIATNNGQEGQASISSTERSRSRCGAARQASGCMKDDAVRSHSTLLPPSTRHRGRDQARAYGPTTDMPLPTFFEDFFEVAEPTEEEEENIEKALKSISNSFSIVHQRLLNLAIGNCSVDEHLAIDLPPDGPLSSDHVRSMSAMVQMEFLASLEKELDHPNEKDLSDPVSFDVFLMEPSLFRGRDLRLQLAVCVPMKKKRGEETKAMMWYDGRGALWDLEPQIHQQKVASLSGTARILENLWCRTSMMRHAMAREMIVDPEDVHAVVGARATTRMNESQQQAVSVVSSPRFDLGLFCVLGPPGTGKTHTISAMIESIGGGTVVTAPSNAAVANLALKVHASARFDMEGTVVFGQNCDKSVSFLNPVHRGQQFRRFVETHDSLTEDDARDRGRKEFAAWLQLDPNDATIEDLARLCPHVNLDALSGRKLLNTMLKSASVIFCTLNSSGSNMLRRAVGSTFSTFILDEAGQCPEAEFYIATTFPGVERIIVVGDPKQLPPCVIDQRCSQRGYGVSWLKRTYDQCPEKVHLLNTQYRMDKSILRFPNEQFYDKRILSGDNVVGREPYVAKPLEFVDTKRGREEKDQFSWKNEYEAVVVKSILNTDEDIIKLRADSPNTRTIIISPYRAQVCLLKEKLKKTRGVEVATVDSFQGQEAEIVILSTVRTVRPGFVDDAQRLNVALTRAKRVLRVVGDLSFFLSLPPDSTLKSLARFYQHQHLTSDARVTSIAWTSPDWGCINLWKPTMSSRFHGSIKNMSEYDKNVCFNILLAVSKPEVKRLIPRPSERTTPSWYVSSLRGDSRHLCLVWIPKCRGSELFIEAHFAGSKDQCNNFIQKHVNIPEGARIVKADLSGVLMMEEVSATKETEIKDLITLWPLTNPLQNAIMSQSIDSLPQGNLVLDSYQQEISVSKPPLLIESRSGTGKTNVLFQHAVIHTQLEQQQSPGCFVTVSPRLCNELKQRYEEMRMIENDDLPNFLFYSRAELLCALLTTLGILEVNVSDLCSFREYCKERSLVSHARSTTEEKLAENEIGGVILGSLTAGLKRCLLSREEYLEEKRSNISNKLEEGKKTRHAVYTEFEKYQKWKHQRNSHDMNDVVLILLGQSRLIGPNSQIFDSAYVDEVQDFSYASLLLICTISGAQALKWTFAGDTAQMISPGCSFTFNGLKQTLLSLKPGIESKLSKVSHLLVNYRTTKDILLLGNAILSIAKKYFPDQIAHSLPEIAMKDLGLKVCTFDFDEANSLEVKFGHNQALIYSSEDAGDSDSHCGSVFRQWLKDHPFILTSLDSKGLEFDDVVVAFEYGRSVWNVTSERVESLRMLRELYVAVTRAKRRVVILVRRKDKAMQEFLDRLDCEIQRIEDPKQFQVEFDSDTSAETWRQKGLELFDDGHFGLAASCFAAANDWGLSNLSKAKHLKTLGNRSEAANAYRRAAQCFFQELDCKRTLDALQELSYCPPWNKSDNALFDAAQSKMPTHFSRHETVRLSLIRDCWENIEVRDLKDPGTSTFFASQNDHPKLKSMIRRCQEEDRHEISKVLPSIVAQYYYGVQNFPSAVELYLRSKEIKLAVKGTKCAVEGTKDVYIHEIVEIWRKNTGLMRDMPDASYVPLLISLYSSPLKAAESAGEKCLHVFGRRVVIFAMERANIGLMNLHSFHPMEFRTEVNDSLESTYSCCTDIVKWFVDKGDHQNANEYVQKKLRKISNDELLAVISLDCKVRPGGLMPELKRRKLLIIAICRIFLLQSSFGDAITAAEMELGSLGQSKGHLSKKFRDAVKRQFQHCKNNGAFLQLHNSITSNFLDLCRDPYFAMKELGTGCAKFGKARILEAISYGGPYADDVWPLLSSSSNNNFKMPTRYELLTSFHKVGNNQSANWYAELNRENWTPKELTDLVKGMGLQQFPIAAELLQRGLAIQALPYAFGSHDDKIATEASILLLSSPASAEKNIVEVLSSWSKGKPNFSPDLLQSPRALLMLFTKDPKFDSCDEMMALLINFGPSVTVFLKIHVSSGNCDKKKLKLIIDHHLDLRQSLRLWECMQQNRHATMNKDTGVEKKHTVSKAGGVNMDPVALKTNSEKRQCRGTNNKKKPCKSFAMQGSDFCEAHAPKESGLKAKHVANKSRRPLSPLSDRRFALPPPAGGAGRRRSRGEHRRRRFRDFYRAVPLHGHVLPRQAEFHMLEEEFAVERKKEEVCGAEARRRHRQLYPPNLTAQEQLDSRPPAIATPPPTSPTQSEDWASPLFQEPMRRWGRVESAHEDQHESTLKGNDKDVAAASRLRHTMTSESDELKKVTEKGAGNHADPTQVIDSSSHTSIGEILGDGSMLLELPPALDSGDTVRRYNLPDLDGVTKLLDGVTKGLVGAAHRTQDKGEPKVGKKRNKKKNRRNNKKKK